MRLGIATDHGGFALKDDLVKQLRAAGHEVIDFGAHQLNNGDDYPDFVVPPAGILDGRHASRVRCWGPQDGSHAWAASSFRY
jgi:ribose 5-phosphate isomerase B